MTQLTKERPLVGVFLDQATLGEGLDWLAFEQQLDWRFYPQTGPDERHQRVAEAQVIVTNKVVLDASVLTAAKNCRLILLTATGTNNVDLAAAKQRGISVCNVTGYAGASVPQHALALLLGLANQWHRYDAEVKQGAWSRATQFCLMHHPVTELAGKQLGIIGYGVLGQAFARLCQALGMTVKVLARPSTPHELALPLDTLLATSDVISLHCPLTAETAGLANGDFFRAMKKSAFFINTSRGPLVDEVALAEALRRGEIAGAALDVLSVEPPPFDHPLLAKDIPNLILTPHNAWISVESRQRLLDGVTHNLQNWLAGNPSNLVN